jgi:hypothetical protein
MVRAHPPSVFWAAAPSYAGLSAVVAPPHLLSLRSYRYLPPKLEDVSWKLRLIHQTISEQVFWRSLVKIIQPSLEDLSPYSTQLESLFPLPYVNLIFCSILRILMAPAPSPLAYYMPNAFAAISRTSMAPGPLSLPFYVPDAFEAAPCSELSVFPVSPDRLGLLLVSGGCIARTRTFSNLSSMAFICCMCFASLSCASSRDLICS